VDADTALERLDRERDRIEREQEDFHERVAAAYIELADRFSERFVVLDASRPADEVHRAVVAAVQDRILTARPQSLAAPKR
jgi:dTMP kinase